MAWSAAVHDWLKHLWTEIREPVTIIVGHLLVTIAAILALAAVELVLEIIGYSRRRVPVIGVTLSDWMYDMDFVAATVIILIGIMKGAIALWKK